MSKRNTLYARSYAAVRLSMESAFYMNLKYEVVCLKSIIKVKCLRKWGKKGIADCLTGECGKEKGSESYRPALYGETDNNREYIVVP